MRILIYGAGVVGSLYAALLADAGYDTSIYARGKRLEILKNDGLLYKKNQDWKRYMFMLTLTDVTFHHHPQPSIWKN